MPLIRFRVQSSSLALQTMTPVWDGRFTWRRQDGEIYFRKELLNDMMFYSDDYTALIALESDLCEEVTVTVERKCVSTDPTWNTEFVGKFSLQSAKINKDDCAIRVKPEPVDAYTCFLEAWDVEQNIYDIATATVQGFEGDYEVDCFTDTNPVELDCPDLVPMSPLASYCAEPESDFCENRIDENGVSYFFRQTCYHRIVRAGTCSGATPVPPGGLSSWTLLTDNCPTDSEYWRCPTTYASSRYTQGRLFNTALVQLIEDTGCGLSVVSDFFNINADASAPANAQYAYAAAYLQRLFIYQKSDVKRHYASDPALSTVFNLTPEDLLNDLKILFNVYWTIEGTVFRIEHASYFTAVAGLNLSGDPLKNEYENDYRDLPDEERFQYMDESSSTAFASAGIQYPCGEGKKDYKMRIISTDVNYIADPSYAEKITDEGFVLMATEESSGVNYLIDDNVPLSFAECHDNLHRHWKAFEDLTINSVAGTATTWRRQRKAPGILTALCCGDDTFDPADEVTTDIGTGQVETAEYNVYTEELTLNLRY